MFFVYTHSPGPTSNKLQALVGLRRWFVDRQGWEGCLGKPGFKPCGSQCRYSNRFSQFLWVNRVISPSSCLEGLSSGIFWGLWLWHFFLKNYFLCVTWRSLKKACRRQELHCLSRPCGVELIVGITTVVGHWFVRKLPGWHGKTSGRTGANP